MCDIKQSHSGRHYYRVITTVQYSSLWRWLFYRGDEEKKIEQQTPPHLEPSRVWAHRDSAGLSQQLLVML